MYKLNDVGKCDDKLVLFFPYHTIPHHISRPLFVSLVCSKSMHFTYILRNYLCNQDWYDSTYVDSAGARASPPGMCLHTWLCDYAKNF